MLLMAVETNVNLVGLNPDIECQLTSTLQTSLPAGVR